MEEIFEGVKGEEGKAGGERIERGNDEGKDIRTDKKGKGWKK